MKTAFTIKYEFAGCTMPASEIASSFGVEVRDTYASRAAAQKVCDKIAKAMFAFGFKEVKLWTVGVTL